MKRLTALEHDVVTDIDDVVDRPEPDRSEALLQPSRTGTDLDPRDHMGEVERTILGSIDTHGSEKVGSIRRVLGENPAENFLRINQVLLEPGG